MLPHSAHRYLANKLNPERERRLLCMNDDDQNDESNGIDAHPLGASPWEQSEERDTALAESTIRPEDLTENLASMFGRRILSVEQVNSMMEDRTVRMTLLDGDYFGDPRITAAYQHWIASGRSAEAVAHPDETINEAEAQRRRELFAYLDQQLRTPGFISREDAAQIQTQVAHYRRKEFERDLITRNPDRFQLSDEEHAAIEKQGVAAMLDRPDIPSNEMIDFLEEPENGDLVSQFTEQMTQSLEDPEKELILMSDLERRLTKYEDLERFLGTPYGTVLGGLDEGRITEAEEFLTEQLHGTRDIDSDPTKERPDIVRWLETGDKSYAHAKRNQGNRGIDADAYESIPDQPDDIAHAIDGLTDQSTQYDGRFRFDLAPENPDAPRTKRDGSRIDLARIQDRVFDHQAKRIAGEGASLHDGVPLRHQDMIEQLRNARRAKEQLQRMGLRGSNRQEVTESVGQVRETIDAFKVRMDERLRERALQLKDTVEQQMQSHVCQEAFNDPEKADKLLAKFGITYRGLKRVIMQSYAPIVRQLRDNPDPIIIPGEEFDVAPDPGSKEYLAYAKDAWQQFDQIERQNELKEIGEQDTDATQHLLAMEKIKHDDMVSWAQHEAQDDKLEKTIEALNSGSSAVLPALQRVLQGQIDPESDHELDGALTPSAIEGLPDTINDLCETVRDVASGSADASDHNALQTFIEEFGGEKTLSLIFQFLRDPHTGYQMAQFADELEERHRVLREEGRYENTEENLSSVEQEFGTAQEELFTKLRSGKYDSNLLTEINAFSQIESQCRSADIKFRFAREHRDTPEGQNAFDEARETARMIAEANELLDKVGGATREIPNAKQFESFTGSAQAAGFYSRDTGEIFLNMEVINSEDNNHTRESVEAHEKRHQIEDIFFVRTKLLHGVMMRVQSLLDVEIPREQQQELGDRTYLWLLRNMGTEHRWNLERKYDLLLYRARQEGLSEDEAKLKAEAGYYDLLKDELLNKFTEWKQGQLNPTDQERVLFEHLQKSLGRGDDVKGPDEDVIRSQLEDGIGNAENKEKIREHLGLFENGDGGEDDGGNEDGGNDDNAGGGGGGGGGQPPPPDDGDDFEDEGPGDLQPGDINRDLRDIKQALDKMEAFMKSYPEHRKSLAELHEEYLGMYRQVDQAFKDKSAPIEKILDVIAYINNGSSDLIPGEGVGLGAIMGEIDRIRGEKIDTSSAPWTGKKGWEAIFDHVEFMTVMDLYKTFKEAGEDIARYWQRRGEAKRAKWGEDLTSWIPSNAPYLGRLKSEFRKRGQSSEQTEVNQWKEALDELDAYALIDMMGHVRNPDILRAILELLTDRGRMDWNDERFWRTLNYMSHYSMPIEACRHDDVLRDRWIQKMITDIYNDKDHYFNWRRKNDGSISSAKKEFTTTVDQLANLSGGMPEELRRQLVTFIKYKNDPANMPQDVNPLLYEEILDYAIRNGKMSMDQKFYYLVMGIHHGMMSIDRLRALAGEEGGFLNEFPFIDYFYQKNNTMAFIHELAERLTETANSNDEMYLRPGLKTNLFIRLEVGREESVKQRLRKGVSKRGENIDHDDIPWFITEMDYTGIEDWFKHMSGGRQKLSKEALKNSYLGFAQKFKALGALAALDDAKLERFTDADVRDAAQTVSAYIFADNILTKNTTDGERDRPSLSASEINNQVPVWGFNGFTTGNYRNQNNDFVEAVMGRFMNNEAIWDDINAHIGNSDKSKSQSDGTWVSINNYGANEIEEHYRNEKLQKNIWKSKDIFAQHLEREFLSDKDGMIQLLKTFSEQDGIGGQPFFLRDGTGGSAYTNDQVKKIAESQGMRTGA